MSWWPALAGLALAGFIALDTSSGSELAAVFAASGFVYLGAAVFRKPTAAWPVFLAMVIVITPAKIGTLPFDATWIFLGLGFCLLGMSCCMERHICSAN